MLKFCDFIQDFVITTNHHLKHACLSRRKIESIVYQDGVVSRDLS